MPMSPQQWWFLMQQLADHGQNEVFNNQASAGAKFRSRLNDMIYGNAPSGQALDPNYPMGGKARLVSSANMSGVMSTDTGQPYPTPNPYEKIPGKSSSQTSPTGQGPIDIPPDPNTGFPAAQGGNPPTTAPFNPKFETPFSSGPPGTNEFTAPTDPQLYYPSTAGANLPTDTGFTYPTDPQQYLSATPSFYEGGMLPAGPDQYLPSESWNVPTGEEMLPGGPSEYRGGGGAAGANVPTYEGMSPIGPNDFLPSAGANVPTNEFMMPYDPQQYYDSTAGANLPTDESMLPTGPDEYLPATETMSYPDGTGGYVDLNADGSPAVASALSAGEPTGDLQGAPYLANVPGAYDPSGKGGLYYGEKGPGFFSRLGTSLYDLPGNVANFFGSAFGNVGPATTYAPFGGHPSSYGGGAFASSPGGIPLGLFGQGSAGNLGSTQSYFDRLSLYRLLHGGDPSLGVNQPGQTIRDVSQFYRPNASTSRGSDFAPAPVLPPSQWGGVSAANAALYSDQGYRPKGAAGHTTGAGPGGIA